MVAVEERDMIGAAADGDLRKMEGEVAAWTIEGQVDLAKSLGFFAKSLQWITRGRDKHASSLADSVSGTFGLGGWGRSVAEPEVMIQEGEWAMTRLGLVMCSHQLGRRIFVGVLSSHVSY